MPVYVAKKPYVVDRQKGTYSPPVFSRYHLLVRAKPYVRDYALSPINVTYSYTLTAISVLMSLTPQNASETKALGMSASAGSLSLVARNASATRAIVMSGAYRALSLNVESASFSVSHVLQAAVGTLRMSAGGYSVEWHVGQPSYSGNEVSHRHYGYSDNRVIGGS